MPPKLAFSVSVQEPRPARRQVVEGAAVTIGSSTEADVVVDDPLVAPRHATLEAVSSNEVSLVDLGSDQGTFVRGERVQRCTLRHGESFRIGDSTITLVGTEPVLEPAGSYRASPVAEAAPPAAPSPRPSVSLTREERELFLPRRSPVELALAGAEWLFEHGRWWPVPTGLAFAAVYLAQHGATLPPWSELSDAGLTAAWPVPRWLLLSGLVGSLCGLGDALTRDVIGDRTLASRLLLVATVIVSAPVLLNVLVGGAMLLPAIGTLVAVVVAISFLGAGLYGLVRWILGRS